MAVTERKPFFYFDDMLHSCISRTTDDGNIDIQRPEPIRVNHSVILLFAIRLNQIRYQIVAFGHGMFCAFFAFSATYPNLMSKQKSGRGYLFDSFFSFCFPFYVNAHKLFETARNCFAKTEAIILLYERLAAFADCPVAYLGSQTLR